jgi:nucleoside-diphosphate-sugar epimerase
MAQKAVVIGGAGFIGSHIADELLARSFEVHAIDNLSAASAERLDDRVTLHQADIRELEAIRPVIEGADWVFHTAALPRVPFSIENPILTHEVNVTGTLHVLKACVDGGVKKMVFSSSSSVYGDQPTLPLHEDMPCLAPTPYGLHKYMGERYCQMFSSIDELPTVSLRYFNVYGPRMDPDGAYALAVGKFLKLRSRDEALPITGDGEQTRDFTHVRDVVRANMLAAESEQAGSGEALNIGAGRNITVNQLAELIGGPREHMAPRQEPRHTRADSTRAQQLLGWRPSISVEEGIAELREEWGLSATAGSEG